MFVCLPATVTVWFSSSASWTDCVQTVETQSKPDLSPIGMELRKIGPIGPGPGSAWVCSDWKFVLDYGGRQMCPVWSTLSLCQNLWFGSFAGLVVSKTWHEVSAVLQVRAEAGSCSSCEHKYKKWSVSLTLLSLFLAIMTPFPVPGGNYGPFDECSRFLSSLIGVSWFFNWAAGFSGNDPLVSFCCKWTWDETKRLVCVSDWLLFFEKLFFWDKTSLMCQRNQPQTLQRPPFTMFSIIYGNDLLWLVTRPEEWEPFLTLLLRVRSFTRPGEWPNKWPKLQQWSFKSLKSWREHVTPSLSKDSTKVSQTEIWLAVAVVCLWCLQTAVFWNLKVWGGFQPERLQILLVWLENETISLLSCLSSGFVWITQSPVLKQYIYEKKTSSVIKLSCRCILRAVCFLWG